MQKFSKSSRTLAIGMAVAVILTSTPFAASAPVARATICVDMVTAQNAVQVGSVSSNGLTSLTQNENNFSIQFGSWYSPDQATAQLTLPTETNITTYTHLQFSVNTNSTSGLTAQDPLLVQLYDNTWTSGKSKEVLVADALSGQTLAVSIALSEFANGVFNPQKVRQLFFRLPQGNKVNASLEISGLSWVTIACEPPPTPPSQGGENGTNPIAEPVEQCSPKDSLSPVALPSFVTRNRLSSYNIVNAKTGSFTAKLAAWNSADQGYLRFTYPSAHDVTTHDALDITLRATAVKGNFGTTPLSIQLYDRYWTKGKSQEVWLDNSILSPQDITVRIPMTDFENAEFHPEQMRHLFFRVPQTGATDLSLVVTKMDWVQTETTCEMIVPEPTPEPTPIPDSVTPPPTQDLGTSMIIDAATTKVPYVDRGILGGNSVDDRAADYFSLDIFKDLGGTSNSNGNNFNRPMWRVHTIDAGQPKNQMMWNPESIEGYKCLNNPMIPSQYSESNWNSQYAEPLMNGQVVCNGENYYEVEWFDPSPTYGVKNRHAISFTKKIGSTITRYRAFNTENPSGNVGLNQNNYLRFDIKLSSQVPFSVKTENIIMAGKKFRVYLKADKSLEVRGGSNFSTVLTKVDPLDLDQWYSVETVISGGLESDEIQLGIMADDSGMGGYGISGSAIINDSFKFVVDEIEVRTKSAGINPSYPFASADQSKKFIPEVLISHHFENGNMTWLDYGEMAEALNLELVIQLPHPCETKFGCQVDHWANDSFLKQLFSVEGHQALIEYMVGTADADYSQKVSAMIASGDWSLTAHNWANLRAYHGRVEPFDLKFVEVGNEPYYYSKSVNGKTATWHGNEAGFANWYIAACEAVKSVKASLKCGIPANSSGNFSFEKVVQSIATKNKGHLVDAFALHSYTVQQGMDRLTQYPFKAMSGAYAYKVMANNQIYKELQKYDDAKKFALQYLGNQPASAERAYWLTEMNTIINGYKMNPADQALDAIYYATNLQYLLENGYHAASYFFWNGSTWGEAWRTGVTGEYNGVPQVNLNGQIAQIFANAIPWGGTVLQVNYDSKDANTEITESNGVWKAPKVTAVATKSANGKKLTLVVVNRDSVYQTYTLDLKNFVPSGNAVVSVLDASAVNETHQTIGMVKSSISASKNFNYSFPGYSVVVMEFTQ